jgi:hypothetical protein
MTRTDQDASEREFFSRMAERAQHFGFKPGFASARFKEQFGDWPPKSWSDRVLRAFAIDPNWQSKLEARTIEREHFDAWERDVKPIAEARKDAWLVKHPPVIRVSAEGEQLGGVVGAYESEKRGRPIHAFSPGMETALCGRLITGWITERKVFTTTTEYGCKKCKAIFAQRDQLPLLGTQ